MDPQKVNELNATTNRKSYLRRSRKHETILFFKIFFIGFQDQCFRWSTILCLFNFFCFYFFAKANLNKFFKNLNMKCTTQMDFYHNRKYKTIDI